MVVVITAGKITGIKVWQKIRVPGNSQVINARGKFLIPGLWDMHVHLSKAGEDTLPLFIANGVTSVRDMGGDYVTLLKMAKGSRRRNDAFRRESKLRVRCLKPRNVARMKREGTVEPVGRISIAHRQPHGKPDKRLI